MVSLGRKNYLFFGSDHGGERGALLYSLIGTCKLPEWSRKRIGQSSVIHQQQAEKHRSQITQN
jgi:transposase